MADHPITITASNDRIVVRWRGRTIVDTTRALELKEHVYPVVLYVPRADADMHRYERSDRHTTCPYKGVASYFHLADGGHRDDNAVWSYETPKAEVAAIAGCLAFYTDKVEIERA